MRRFLLTSVLMVATVFALFADEVSFVASAPKSVVVNQQFRLSYKVNRQTNQPIAVLIERNIKSFIL